jgi:hypothetical protein
VYAPSPSELATAPPFEQWSPRLAIAPWALGCGCALFLSWVASAATAATAIEPAADRMPAAASQRFEPAGWDADGDAPVRRLPPVKRQAEPGERLPPVFDATGPDFDSFQIEPIATPPPLDAAMLGRDESETGDSASNGSASAPGMGGPLGGKAPFSMTGFWAPPSGVKGQDTNLGMNMQLVNLGFPLWRPDDRGMLVGIANFERLELSGGAMLTGTTQPVPNQLWSLQLGTMHTRDYDNGWNGGGMFLFGSASDRPFAALRDMTFTLALFANRPAKNQRDAWNVSLLYSPTAQLPYPMPGLAYVWRPSPKVEASIGVPFSLTYRPTEQTSLAVTYVPLTNFNARAARTLESGWTLYSDYQIYTETFFLADRIESRERFYVFDQRVSVGTERVLRSGFALNCSALYMFNRQLFQGTNFFSDRNDVVRFDPGVGLSANLVWRR